MAYSDADMLRMQQDAIRRVHDMQRRANHAVQGGGQMPQHPSGGNGSPPRRQPVQNPFQRPISPPAPITSQEHNPVSQDSSPLSGIKDILSSLKGSSDTFLILALLLVLVNNDEQDMLLMLALLYLLL